MTSHPHTREELAPARLANAAFALLRPGETVFLDSSPAMSLLARLIAQTAAEVHVITNSLPVLNELSSDVVAIGGDFRPDTQSYAGPAAVRAIREHFADRLFFGVAGVSSRGVMTEPDALEAEVKRAMLEHSEAAVLLLDRIAGAVGHHAVGRINLPEIVIADTLSIADLRRLQSLGSTVYSTSAPTA